MQHTRNHWFFVPFFLFLFNSCEETSQVDLIVFNAKIYTVDSAFSIAQALAVKDGKIIAIGKEQDITGKYFSDNKINAGGKIIYPGFIDAHAHFFRYGLGLQTADLVDTESWEQILHRLDSFAKSHPDGWLLGRGWDQNDWQVKEFPTKEKLDEMFPNRPVVLTRIDGHAAIANQKALDLAGLKPGDTISGGSIEQKGGELTGILVDNATDLVYAHVPNPGPGVMTKSLEEGQAKCFAVGLTTVDDCGLNYRDVLMMDSLQKKEDPENARLCDAE